MRCFTILGPSQTGKTTLLEKLTQFDETPARRDDDGDLGIVRFSALGEPWCAIDFPGGPEYAGMAGSALLASDIAVLCVAPDPNEAVLAAPYIRAIEASGTPCLLFINRMDTPKARVRDIVAALQAYSSHAIVLRQVPIREDGQVVGAVDLISERAWRYREGQPSSLVEIPEQAAERESEARAELLESLSDFDDWLLEELIEDREPATGALFSISTRAVQESTVVPALMGSALHMNGVQRLLKALRHETPQVERLRERLTGEDAPVAVGFHARMRKHVGKTVFVRALNGGLASGESLGGSGIGGLVEVGGTGNLGNLGSGEVGVTVKSDQLSAGHLFTQGDAIDPPDWAQARTPAFARVLTAQNERDEVRLSTALAKLRETDPSLTIGHEDVTGQPLLGLQGPMHLRRILETLSDDFGITVDERPPEATYRETISKQVDEHYRHRKQSGGAGQFADVQLIVRPSARGEGFAFDEVVKGGAVPRNYIPSVEHGAQDALETGPLGFPVVDVSVTLTDGKAHSVDSSDFAFRTAGRMGVREAMQKADPVLLQPIERVHLHVPSVFSGTMVSLVSSLKGQVLGFDRDPSAEGWDIFRALMPASVKDELLRALGAATQGTAWCEASFDHFEEIYGKEAEKISRAKAEASA